MIAPKMIGLVRSTFGFALWNDNFEPAECEERYIRATDAEFLLSVIDGLVEATGESVGPDDIGMVEQIRADLSASKLS